MNYFGKIFSNISAAYNEINPATLTGAIDVIVVEREDGTFLCSPFHVRFGKMGVLRSREKIVDISVNGNPVPIHMKLGDSGEAYFLEECEENSVTEVTINNSQKSIDPPSSSSRPFSELSTSPSSHSAESDKENRSQSEFDFSDDENEEAKLSLAGRKPNDPLATPRSSQERNNLPKKVRRKKKNKAAKNESKQQLEASRRACDPDETLLNVFDDEALHPFSDSEISVDNKKIKKMSMDSFDYKSDSEVEMSKQNDSPPISHDNISWGWGELPNVSTDMSKKDLSICGVPVPVPIVNEDITPNGSPTGSSSMLGGVLSFMNREKEKEDENDKGIYLSDLNPDDMNPEVAAKYFPQFRSSSFSSPPVAVVNNSNVSKPLSICTSEDEIESGKGASLPNSPNYAESYMKDIECFKNINTFDLITLSKLYHDMSMSLCGGIENLYNNSSDSEKFLQCIISFDDFSENPLQFIDNPNLVIRMGGRYFTWKMASSILLSLLMFQRPLPEKTMEDLKNRCIPKKKAPNLGNAKSSWRSWFRSNQTELSNQISNELDNTSDRLDATIISSRNGTANNTTAGLNFSHEYISDDETNKMFAGTSNNTGNGHDQTHTTVSNIGNNKMSNKKKYKKVLRLHSDVIKSLQLQPNSNDIEFSVTTAFQGTTVCQSKIFLWRHDDKIVISDIDGTITRSDVLGHILPIIGNNWAQMGVTNLFTQIENNGYKFLYLSARAIGQAKSTRDYLRSISQDEIVLPDGPVLLSPTSLFSALHREVIEKKPEEFKIACLRDIQKLFSHNPFFAGFGNKVNDMWAYNAVGIDHSRIFTINHKGEVKLEKLLKFKSSYTDLSRLVDQMFPPLYHEPYNQQYSSFMFWRNEIPNLDEPKEQQQQAATTPTPSTPTITTEATTT